MCRDVSTVHVVVSERYYFSTGSDTESGSTFSPTQCLYPSSPLCAVVRLAPCSSLPMLSCGLPGIYVCRYSTNPAIDED
ncbi:hypothetical protein E2C01_088789 [Portunus trituberculatus]|uniref:Uncharacterized protein n=1 Tax=Portunus trituberculatus TaxID=210409 RepID=A0A5B7JBR2_PORTR|nr:hypothetical protein [Portunus trituberculatus]